MTGLSISEHWQQKSPWLVQIDVPGLASQAPVQKALAGMPPPHADKVCHAYTLLQTQEDTSITAM